MKYLGFVLLVLSSYVLISCSQEEWYCRTKGDMMYSESASGKLGGADKGCSCEQIRNHEYLYFRSVDEQALKSDFGC
jgi:hypothetical protein